MTVCRCCRARDCGLEFAWPQLSEAELARAYAEFYYPQNGQAARLESRVARECTTEVAQADDDDPQIRGEAELFAWISEGVEANAGYGIRGISSGRMPHFGAVLTKTQIEAIMAAEHTPSPHYDAPEQGGASGTKGKKKKASLPELLNEETSNPKTKK